MNHDLSKWVSGLPPKKPIIVKIKPLSGSAMLEYVRQNQSELWPNSEIFALIREYGGIPICDECGSTMIIENIYGPDNIGHPAFCCFCYSEKVIDLKHQKLLDEYIDVTSESPD